MLTESRSAVEIYLAAVGRSAAARFYSGLGRAPALGSLLLAPLRLPRMPRKRHLSRPKAGAHCRYAISVQRQHAGVQ